MLHLTIELLSIFIKVTLNNILIVLILYTDQVDVKKDVSGLTKSVKDMQSGKIAYFYEWEF